jgi:glycosyltransferase involved in cell wall biosynthesis
LKQQVIERGLSQRFVFTGALPYAEMPGALAAADICIAPFDPCKHPPSAGAGYQLDPLKLFEYLALQKPVVSIQAENIERLFRHEQDMLLVPPRDPGALNAALCRLAADPQLAKRLATSGEAKVRQNHTWASHADHLVRLFEEMLGE